MNNNENDVNPIIPVKFIKTHPDAQLPHYHSVEAAGMDLTTVERLVLEPGKRYVVDTGLKMELPKGYEAQIRPRSGLAAKHGVTVLNTPGTIDSDYRGPVKVILINLGEVSHTIMCPDRIAQMIISPVQQAQTFWAENLSETKRGEGGLGSTGK